MDHSIFGLNWPSDVRGEHLKKKAYWLTMTDSKWWQKLICPFPLGELTTCLTNFQVKIYLKYTYKLILYGQIIITAL
jgi:hypothetical protein